MPDPLIIKDELRIRNLLETQSASGQDRTTLSFPAFTIFPFNLPVPFFEHWRAYLSLLRLGLKR